MLTLNLMLAARQYKHTCCSGLQDNAHGMYACAAGYIVTIVREVLQSSVWTELRRLLLIMMISIMHGQLFLYYMYIGFLKQNNNNCDNERIPIVSCTKLNTTASYREYICG